MNSKKEGRGQPSCFPHSNIQKKVSRGRLPCFSHLRIRKKVSHGNLSGFSRRPSQKRADSGETVISFVATILVILIILGSVLISGFVKKAAGIKGGVKVDEESEVGLGNVLSYGDNYISLLEVKFLIGEGQGVDSAMREADYAG